MTDKILQLLTRLFAVLGELSDALGALSPDEVRALSDSLAEASRARVIEDNKKNNNLELIDNQKERERMRKKEKENENDGNFTHFARSFIDYFNETMRKAGALIPHQCKLTAKRKSAIAARCHEHGREALKVMADKAARSAFLNGGGRDSWTATIDWLLRPNNFVKVIEGNYDNNNINPKSNGNNRQRRQDLDRRRGTEALPHTAADFAEEV